MAFGGFNKENGASPMVEMNTTPLVDVMLVLLIVFMITAPVMKHAVNVDLPQASSTPSPETPKSVIIAIQANGQVVWESLPVTTAQLQTVLARQAAQAPETEVRLRIDKAVPYDQVAQLMAEIQGAGLTKMGFETQPDKT